MTVVGEGPRPASRCPAGWPPPYRSFSFSFLGRSVMTVQDQGPRQSLYVDTRPLWLLGAGPSHLPWALLVRGCSGPSPSVWKVQWWNLMLAPKLNARPCRKGLAYIVRLSVLRDRLSLLFPSFLFSVLLLLLSALSVCFYIRLYWTDNLWNTIKMNYYSCFCKRHIAKLLRK